MFPKVQPFSHDKSCAYDQSSYIGRLFHFTRFVSPGNAFYTDKEILELRSMLSEHANGKLNKQISDDDLWRAKYAVVSNTHPDTGDIIPKVFRMSYFVPANIPMAIGLTIAAPTTFNLTFWQIVNQSYNFGVNVTNSNASNRSSELGEITKNYVMAIASSVTVGLFLKNRIMKTKFAQHPIIVRFVPFMAGVTANILNLFTARYRDLDQGLFLKDFSTGEIIKEHKSKVAGSSAFWQSAFSRFMIPIPVTFFPALFFSFLKKKNLFPASNLKSNILNIAVSSFTLGAGLPIALAAFPQEAKIHKSKLEPEFQNLKNSKGETIEYFVYNKGL